jgi:hypothetical protein
MAASYIGRERELAKIGDGATTRPSKGCDSLLNRRITRFT